ncbi:ABC transporter permease [Natronomonas aquatica]|uniref:ABC transporter permease n=1 Tax=Natronomonas aquatica TaxID=2841590 RepID=UPI00210B323D|nr:ABC transporter permease [Natronomonas aquatica]
MSRRTIARRELQSLSREKTILLALLIQLVIAAFSSFLVVGLTSIYEPDAAEDDVVVGVTGEEADELVTAAAAVDGLQTRRYDGSVRAAFDRNEIQAIATVERRGGRIVVDVEAPQSSLQKTLVVVQLRAALEELERAERSERNARLSFEPLPLPPSVDASPYFGFSYTVLVPLLVFLPVFISGAVVVDSIAEEIERGTLELLRVTPATLVEIVEGKAGVMAALVPLQVLFWIGLLELNGIAIANVAAIVTFASAVAVVAVVFAAALALSVPVRQRAQLSYSLGLLAAFAAAALLPEHPATTVALLAIDSATATTYAHLGAAVVAAVGFAGVLRVWVEGFDPETLG